MALAGAGALAAWRFWPESSSPHKAKPAPGEGKGADPEVASGSAGEGASAKADQPEGPAEVLPGPVRMRSGRRTDDDGISDDGAMSEEFAAEARNPEWAEKQEAEVDRRAQEILAASARDAPPGSRQVVATKSECRSHTCRFVLRAGDTRALARALEWLGDPDGFATSADDLRVEAIELGPDGPRVVNLFLRYAR